MTEHEPTFEQDGRFPSGLWTGFFLQRPSTARHWMELRLTFRGGALRGDGHDQVGAFTLDGHYDLTDGRCWWTKRYVGQHEVSYAGHNEGKGIWGVWEIPPWDRGGFHIWPADMADPTQETRTTEEQAPVEAVSRRGLATPVGPRLAGYVPQQAGREAMHPVRARHRGRARDEQTRLEGGRGGRADGDDRPLGSSRLPWLDALA
jgi:hypothetical protein